jgi:hypothetical protein
MTWQDWLRRLRHDLVKRVLWPARDRKDMGGPVVAGELRPRLIDDEGRPTSLLDLWRVLRDEAPQPSHPALDAFETVLQAADVAAGRDDMDGVLALDPAFARLTADLASDFAKET